MHNIDTYDQLETYINKRRKQKQEEQSAPQQVKRKEQKQSFMPLLEGVMTKVKSNTTKKTQKEEPLFDPMNVPAQNIEEDNNADAKRPVRKPPTKASPKLVQKSIEKPVERPVEKPIKKSPQKSVPSKKIPSKPAVQKLVRPAPIDPDPELEPYSEDNEEEEDEVEDSRDDEENTDDEEVEEEEEIEEENEIEYSDNDAFERSDTSDDDELYEDPQEEPEPPPHLPPPPPPRRIVKQVTRRPIPKEDYTSRHQRQVYREPEPSPEFLYQLEKTNQENEEMRRTLNYLQQKIGEFERYSDSLQLENESLKDEITIIASKNIPPPLQSSTNPIQENTGVILQNPQPITSELPENPPLNGTSSTQKKIRKKKMIARAISVNIMCAMLVAFGFWISTTPKPMEFLIYPLQIGMIIMTTGVVMFFGEIRH